jgi:thiamine-monophosphate kinase
MTNGDQRLDELGERRIIEEILRPRYGSHKWERFGDDCAFVADGSVVGSGYVVATTDPCPEPMAAFLGYTDLYYRGWLLATINLSDLAAAGARPLGFLSSLVLKNDTTVQQLNRLLDGIDDCCRACGARVVGGNLKEGSKIDLTGTAIGVCNNGKGLSRVGCQNGDLVAVIGELGLFWAGTLSVMRNIRSDYDKAVLLRNVLTPLPKVHVSQDIADRKLLTACLDNSDGLYPSLVQLSDLNQLQMYVRADAISYSAEVLHICSLLAVDPLRLALGWGDWQLIGCCHPTNLNALRTASDAHGVPLHVIGEVRHGRGVVLEYKERVAEMNPLDSQRFTRDSWFTAGLGSYVDALMNGPLWRE